MKTLRSISIFLGIFASAFFLTLELATGNNQTQQLAWTGQTATAECNRTDSGHRTGRTFDQCYDRLMLSNSSTAGAPQYCETEAAAAVTAINTFQSSCSGSSMAGRCVAASRCCTSAQNVSEADEGDPEGCSGLAAGDGDLDAAEDDVDRSSRFDRITGGLLRSAGGRSNRQTAQSRAAARRYRNRTRQYHYCPALAQDHFQSTQEASDRADERVEKLQDQLNDAQTQLTEAQSKQIEDRNQLEDDLKELQDNYERDSEQIKTDLGTEQSEAIAAMEALVQEIEQANDQLKQMILSEQGIWDEFILKSRELRSQCHSDALKAVSDIRAGNATLAANGRLTAGGFNAALRGSGLTDIERGDALVERMRRSCMRDENYSAQVSALTMKRDGSLRALNLDRDRVNALIQSKQASLAQKRNSAPEAVQKAMEKLQRLMTKTNESLQRLQARGAQKEQQNAAAIQRAQEKVERLQRRLNEAETRESELNRMVQLQEEHGATDTGSDAPATGSGAANGNSTSVVASNLVTAQSLATAFASAHCCENQQPPGACHSRCGPIRTFLSDNNITFACPQAQTTETQATPPERSTGGT